MGGSANRSYGQNVPLVDVFPFPIFKTRAPGSKDKNYLVGQVWVYKVSASARSVYIFGGLNGSGVPIWSQAASSTGDLSTLTGTSGGAISPIASNITFAAGTGMASIAGTAGTLTFNVNFASPPAIGSGTPAAITGTTVASTGAMTAGTGITSTTGNIVASAGDITATLGNIAASAGSVSAGTSVAAGTTVTGGTGVVATTGAVSAAAGQLLAGGDTGGVASTVAITNGNSTTIGAGVGSVKMSSGNSADNTAWVKIYVGTDAYWIPAWTTNSP